MVDEKKPSEAKQVGPGPETQNEGEGSRSAARRYDAGAEKMAKSGKVDDLAKKAKEALDGEEGDELERAENEAQKGPR